MCANVTRVPLFRVWSVLIVCGFGAGCHQPYQPNYYHQPGMYGQPLPQGQPGMQQMQPGMQQMQPGMQYMQPGMQPGMQPMPPGQFAPGISSVPNDTFYTPQSPGQPMAPSPGGDAPAFGNPGAQPNPGGNSGSGSGSGNQGVPRYNDPTSSDSPYFERSSQRQPTFGAPASANLTAAPSGQGMGSPNGQQVAGGFAADEFSGNTGVATAEFARDDSARADIDLTGSVSYGSYGQFEPPIERPSPRAVFDTSETAEQTARPMSPPEQFASSEPHSDPFGGGEESTPTTPHQSQASHAAAEPRQPRPTADLFELAAPPLEDEPTSAGGGVLEGVVRRVASSPGWVLTFPAGQGGEAPFGGQLPLTGKPEVLQSLRDGTPYRLRGVLETEDGDPPRARFHVNQVDSLGTPFAQPE